MRVLIAFNEPVLPPTHPEADSENDILEVVDAVVARLKQCGIEPSRLPVSRDLSVIRGALRNERPDVVLNLFEGFGDDPKSECRFASLLAEEGVPFTGSSAETLWRGGRKDLAKQQFASAGLTTPAWAIVERLPLFDFRLKWPVIVKPTFRDASVGIHQSSVVADCDKLEERIAGTAEKYGFPVLAEEFIDGHEVSAAVVDCPTLIVLPLVETIFVGNNGDWPIDSYDAKWLPGSRDHAARTVRYPAELPPALANRVIEMARNAYHALECRGFATIDFRVRDDTPYLLEVNPNADLKPTDCLTELLRSAGIEYSEFLLQMIRGAKARHEVR